MHVRYDALVEQPLGCAGLRIGTSHVPSEQAVHVCTCVAYVSANNQVHCMLLHMHQRGHVHNCTCHHMSPCVFGAPVLAGTRLHVRRPIPAVIMAPKRTVHTNARVENIKTLRAAAQQQLRELRSDLKKERHTAACCQGNLCSVPTEFASDQALHCERRTMAVQTRMSFP